LFRNLQIDVLGVESLEVEIGFAALDPENHFELNLYIQLMFEFLMKDN
jgi:hypothetical protein